MGIIGSSNHALLLYTEESNDEDIGYSRGDNLRELQITGESFKYSRKNIESKNINNTRQTMGLTNIDRSVSGKINIEMAPKVYDPFLQAVMYSDWQSVPKNDDYTITTESASTINDHGGVINDVDGSGTISTGLVCGQWIYIRQSTGDTIQSDHVGIYKIKSTSNNSITIDSSTPISGDIVSKTCKICASMIRASINGEQDNLKKHKFFFERQHIDISPNQFFAFNGNYVNSFSMSGANGAFFVGSFDIVGETVSIYNSSEEDSETNPNGNGVGSVVNVYSDETLEPISFNGFNTVSHVKNIYIDGEDVNTSADNGIYIQSIDFSISNNVRKSKRIGSIKNLATQVGAFVVNGSMTLYFSNDKVYRKFVGNNSFCLSYIIENDNGDAYVFTFPKVLIIESRVNAQAKHEDSLEKIQWTGLFDENTKTSIQIDRLYSDYKIPTTTFYITSESGDSIYDDNSELVSIEL